MCLSIPLLQEEEAEQMLAPEDYVTEEENLRKEREAAARAEAEQVGKPAGPHTCMWMPAGVYLLCCTSTP